MSSTRCSDLRWCYLQQRGHFFQSDTHPVIRNKSPLLDLQSYFWSKGLRCDKPSHKHDSNKYQTKAFVICDHKSDQTRSAAYVNKTYLVWLMYWLLFNQHYQHRSNQKLRSPTNAASDWRAAGSVDYFALETSIKPSMFCLRASQIWSDFSICGRRLQMLWSDIYLNHVLAKVYQI